MALSKLKRKLGHLFPRKKETRIIILLGIDTAFFLLELSAGTLAFFSPCAVGGLQGQGYAVNSLALIADAFHMVRYLAMLMVIVTFSDYLYNS